MNNQPLRAINNNFAENDNNYVTRPLDSHFNSFGDALYSYLNSAGYQDADIKQVNQRTVQAFCDALMLPAVGFDTPHILRHKRYFKSDVWFYNYMKENGYERLGNGNFLKLDPHFRPIAIASINPHPTQNIQLSFYGAEHEVISVREEVMKHIAVDDEVQERPTYFEVVMRAGPMGEGLGLETHSIDNERDARPEYYPYLDGGLEALITDFLQSDETVLILMGPPGTGKSSAMMATTEKLNLLPIYANKAKVVMNDKFISFIMGTSDSWMAKVAGTDARRRSDLFEDSVTEDREFYHNTSPFDKEDEEATPRIPVMLVEDADLLLAPRTSGNALMGELLNETDGISSNHTRKIIFTVNLASESDIDQALIRDGRCYGVINFRNLTPAEAIAARAAAGLPEFEEEPTKDMPLATALRKPRKRICLSTKKNGIGFTTK